MNAGLSICNWIDTRHQVSQPAAQKCEIDKARVKQQIEVLEQKVATQEVQLDEINAVIGPRELGELDLDSIQLEVTTEPRGVVDLPPRYDLIDVVDERPGADQ